MPENAVTVDTKTTDHGMTQFLSEIAKANRIGVDAGIFADKKSDDGTPIALYALANEYGVEEGAYSGGDDDGVPSFNRSGGMSMRIVSRPFMRTSFDRNRQRYIDAEKKMLNDFVNGKIKLIAVYSRLGMAMRTDIVKTIRNWTTPGNAQSTIDRKGKDDPLQDTNSMLNAVQSRVNVEKSNSSAVAQLFKELK